MKTKFIFAALLFFACNLTLTAQDKSISASAVQLTTVKPGSGANPTTGQEYLFHIVVATPAGETIFSSKEMNVPVHGTIGDDTDKEATAIYETMLKMQKGGKYRLDVPKEVLSNPKQAEALKVDHLVYDIELISFSDARPSGAKLIQDLASEKGADEAQARFKALQLKNTEGYVFNEWDMNRAGYTLLEEEKTDAAIAVFKMNVQLNPKSWNAYDSLGDSYIAKGDTDSAKTSFETALKLNPDYKASQEKLEKL